MAQLNLQRLDVELASRGKNRTAMAVEMHISPATMAQLGSTGVSGRTIAKISEYLERYPVLPGIAHVLEDVPA